MSSGATMPAAAPHSIDMLQTVIRLPSTAPRWSNRGTRPTQPWPPRDARPADQQHHVLARHARWQLALDCHRQVRGRALRQASASRARAPPRRYRCRRRAPRTPRGWRCANRRIRSSARLRQAELGSDHVHDALVLAAHRVERDALRGSSRSSAPSAAARSSSAAASCRPASACCGPWWRASGRAAAPYGRPAAAPRMPAARSPRGRGGGRRTGGRARPGRADDVVVPDLLGKGSGHQCTSTSPQQPGGPSVDPEHKTRRPALVRSGTTPDPLLRLH